MKRLFYYGSLFRNWFDDRQSFIATNPRTGRLKRFYFVNYPPFMAIRLNVEDNFYTIGRAINHETFILGYHFNTKSPYITE